MIIEITAQGQAILPDSVLEAMGVKPGDRLEPTESPDGYLLRPKRIDYSRLGTLRDRIPRGHPQFDIRKFRGQPYDPALRN